MFGFGKVSTFFSAHGDTVLTIAQSSAKKKEKDATVVAATPASNEPELSIYEDGRDKYWGLENVSRTIIVASDVRKY